MTALALLLALAAGVDEYATPRQLWIEARVCKGDPLGSRGDGSVKHLAEPVLSCFAGQSASFATYTGDEKVKVDTPYRLQVECHPTVLRDGSIHVVVTTGVTTVNEINLQVNGVSTPVPVYHTQTTRHTRSVKPNEPFRVRMSADSAQIQTWAELTLSNTPAKR